MYDIFGNMKLWFLSVFLFAACIPHLDGAPLLGRTTADGGLDPVTLCDCDASMDGSAFDRCVMICEFDSGVVEGGADAGHD